jgi:type I restriction enzyme R subunit
MRVMLVADKFQTGFDQQTGRHVRGQENRQPCGIVQTFARLNRTAPGKDEVFIIDFVNDPENVRKALPPAKTGAHIGEVQDLNVVYEIKERLDDKPVRRKDLAAFKEARFKTIRDITHTKSPQHKALYAATAGATALYNDKMKMLRGGMATWEAAFEKARAKGDEAGMKSADHHQDEYAEQIRALMGFNRTWGASAVPIPISPN